MRTAPPHDALTDVGFVWYFPGETNPTLEVSETGLYQLESFDIDGDSSTDEIEVTFYDVPIVTEITEVQDYCISGGGDSSLDLNQFKDPLLDDSQDPNNFNYTFYASEAEATPTESYILYGAFHPAPASIDDDEELAKED